MGAFLGAILTFGDINNVAGLSFFGFNLPKMQYNGTLLTSIIGVILLSFVYKLIDKIMPKEITYFFTPSAFNFNCCTNYVSYNRAY